MSLLTSGVEPSPIPSPPLEHRLAPVIDTHSAASGQSGNSADLIRDQAVDAITRAGREPQRRDPEDHARGRGYPMSKWAIVFNYSDREFWAYPWESSPDDQLKVSEK